MSVTFKGQMLRDSIKRGDLSGVVSLLENGNMNLEERDEEGHTHLMLACAQGELSIVRELLEVNVDVNDVDNENWSALMYAAKQGHLEIVIELLEKDALVDHRNMCGWTPLMWACYKGQTLVVQELLEKRADPNIKAEHNMMCLSWASGRGHVEIVQLLIFNGAKINAADKYGTTPLIWAARKGHRDIVDILLENGADVDVAGMNSWTALLVATRGGFANIVHKLLEHDPHVNAVDKDGFTALAIAAKEGHTEIVHDLLGKGAYVNLADRGGDTILIHAVKGGHVEVVRALLKKFADVDVRGVDGKSALYWAVDKGHSEILKSLLNSDPDLEICNKDGNTALLKAVRNRNETCVFMLLEKGAKVSAVDKNGDTVLHIALRTRSKRISELLLRNPKNSRLLYKANKAGETPYSIDAYYQKGILTQIFGHRNLNATDAENLLGYEIYSSALADVLSEPSLGMPITVGLFAKWGSGKSFLINKLQKEMKLFTQQNVIENFEFSKLLFFLLFFINVSIGLILTLSLSWKVGVAIGAGLFPLQYSVLGILWISSNKYGFKFAIILGSILQRNLHSLTLLLQLLFCNPRKQKSSEVPAVRFLFSECTRLTSVGGEKWLAAMISTLSDVTERMYGVLATRLFRVMKTKSYKSGMGRFKMICCIPYFVIVMIVIFCLVVGVSLLVLYGITDNTAVNVTMVTLACIVALSIISNVYTCMRALSSLTTSQKRRVLQAANQLDTLKMDGFMHKLKFEVDLLGKMVVNFDSFTQTHTRLVVIVDGLDSCEQEKVLQVLDTVKVLFSDADSPFITILVVDPHIVIRGIEQNLRVTLLDPNINGYNYLRNVVHLPFYLQSQGLRMQKQDSFMHSSNSTDSNAFTSESPNRAKLQDSAYSNHDQKIKMKWRQSCLQVSSTHTSTFDLSHTLVKNDYFSDINPRSMQRLLNIVAVTGRLLRAYNIEFNWYRLAAWVNLVEQWAYHVSWIILYFEENESLEDSITLTSIYQKIVHQIPVSRDVEPLLEIDRNVRKLEVFLAGSASRSTPLLNIGDLKKFLPCTINLDPYLRKLIRETKNNMDIQRQDYPYGQIYGSQHGPSGAGAQPPVITAAPDVDAATTTSRGMFGAFRQSATSMAPRFTQPYPQPVVPYGSILATHTHPMMPYLVPSPAIRSSSQVSLVPELSSAVQKDSGNLQRLSSYTIKNICDVITKLPGIDATSAKEYAKNIEANNISGLVLLTCDLEELKNVLMMKFGDWQLFRTIIQQLRDKEILSPQISFEHLDRNINALVTPSKTNYFDASKPDKKSVSEISNASRQKYTKGQLAQTSDCVHFSRKDSILEQLQLESQILREVVEDFTETPADESGIFNEQSDMDNCQMTVGAGEECSSEESSVKFSISTPQNVSPINSEEKCLKSEINLGIERDFPFYKKEESRVEPHDLAPLLNSTSSVYHRGEEGPLLFEGKKNRNVVVASLEDLTTYNTDSEKAFLMNTRPSSMRLRRPYTKDGSPTRTLVKADSGDNGSTSSTKSHHKIQSLQESIQQFMQKSIRRSPTKGCMDKTGTEFYEIPGPSRGLPINGKEPVAYV